MLPSDLQFEHSHGAVQALHESCKAKLVPCGAGELLDSLNTCKDQTESTWIGYTFWKC